MPIWMTRKTRCVAVAAASFVAASFVAASLAATSLAISLLTVPPATAAERLVRLQTPADIGKDLSPIPRIAGPVDRAEQRINAAVARLDLKVRAAAADCGTEGGKDHASWERSVRVPMQGPRYISYVITDNSYCGGAHPNVSTMSIVYDLTSGSPIDWPALLPPSLTGTPALDTGADGTKMIVLSGERLYALYLKHYSHGAPEPHAKEEDKECREAVATAGFDGKPPGMMAWLDAKDAALVVHFDLAHAVQACAEEVAIPVADLRAEGAKPMLVEAIEAAHRGASKP